MVALVALRLSLGCHFLYEGVWKIGHSDFRYDERWKAEGSEEFTAKPFLALAKGPMAGFFYAMLPDIDGRERLRVIVKDENGKSVKSIDAAPIAERWKQVKDEFVDYYHVGNTAEADKIHKQYLDQLNDYLKENTDDIVAYFGSLDRFEKDPERNQESPFQKERRWNRMLDLRAEADKWIKDIEAQERAYAHSLYGLLDDAQQYRGLPSASWNPFKWDRLKQINFAVTFALTAIGFCLMAGLCTRLSALGGAAFMCFVVLTQPAWPTIFPHDPPVVGHALLINKDFIEMMALLVIAAAGAGRWASLDIFVNRWIVGPVLNRMSRKVK